MAEKKPISKKTRSLLDQLQRKRGIRDLAQRILIVCEDNKSAPSYFKALKRYFNLSATSVQVEGSGGSTQPIQVVRKAIMLMESARSQASSTEPYSQVWCVIDGDYGSKIVNARESASKRGVKLAVSTKCFEYWLLLHYEEYDRASMDCDSVVSVLRRKRIPNYEKGVYDFREMVKRVEDAVARAEKLRLPGIMRNELPEDQNPCSEVYLLINAVRLPV